MVEATKEAPWKGEGDLYKSGRSNGGVSWAFKRMWATFVAQPRRPTHRPSVRIRPEVATRRRHERRLKRLDHTRGG